VGWRETDQMLRIVTFGWGQVLARLKAFLDSGKPVPSSTSERPRQAGCISER